MLINIKFKCTYLAFLHLFYLSLFHRLFHLLKHLITQIKSNTMYSFMALEAEAGTGANGINNVRSRT